MSSSNAPYQASSFQSQRSEVTVGFIEILYVALRFVASFEERGMARSVRSRARPAPGELVHRNRSSPLAHCQSRQNCEADRGNLDAQVPKDLSRPSRDAHAKCAVPESLDTVKCCGLQHPSRNKISLPRPA